VRAPVAVALDAPDLVTMRTWVRAAAPYVSCAKVGLEMFYRSGAAAVEAVRDEAPELDVFLDVKLHDIPATVRGASLALAPLAPTYLTVHASGGPAMVEAAAVALPDTRITAVTVLTCLDAEILAAMGWTGSPSDIVVTLARQAVDAGARAIVCSPQEVAAVRAVVREDVTLITPGVRPSGSHSHDQVRTATPRAALEAGADLLVIGRPITEAPDIAAAASAIATEVSSP
jgi:orotidine-5'-phosphate decarboxylase